VADPILRVHEVSKSFALNRDKSLKERLVLHGRSRARTEAFVALDNVSFDLGEGQTLGLIGHNGSGKSTLLKIIGGILTPNSGFVERRGRLAALLELGAGFHPDLTGRENVYLNASILGLTRAQTDQYFDAIIDFSGIEEFIDTQVKFYSSGMYVRLAFAVAVHVDPEILLVDEVLAVGDEPFQRKCLERIKSFQREGRTIVFVTHGLDITRQLCNRVILLEHGRILVDGLPTEALREFRDRNAPEATVDNSERGDRRMEVVSTSITDSHGRPRERFEPGDDVAIEVEVVAHQPTEDWALGIAITNEVDTLIYGTNSAIMGVDLGPARGTRTMRYTIPSIPMVEGRYEVTVAVHSSTGLTYHHKEQAAQFRVFSTAAEVGTLHLTPRLDDITATADRHVPAATAG
jgi:ABC-2 type transport system ATP-binding protein